MSFFKDRVKLNSKENKPFKVIDNNEIYYNWAWLKYCVGLSDVFRFLNDNERINEIFEDKPKSNIFGDISGFGNALTSDFLKEVGHIDLIKPDVHIMEIYKHLTNSQKTPASKKVQEDFSKWIGNQKDKEKYTPYYIDKILWLCCTGDFYEDGIIMPKMTRLNFLSYFANYYQIICLPFLSKKYLLVRPSRENSNLFYLKNILYK